MTLRIFSNSLRCYARGGTKTLFNVTANSLVDFSDLYTVNSPAEQTIEDVGRFYLLSDKDRKALFINSYIRNNTLKLFDTLNETAIMVRKPAIEIIGYLKKLNLNYPSPRFLVYGDNGHGKTMTLAHLLHYCYDNSWIICNVPYAGEFIYRNKDIAQSPFHPGKIDTPDKALAWLETFKSQNSNTSNNIETLCTRKNIEWSKREKTEKNTPLLELVDFGIHRTKFACSVVNVLLNELLHYSSKGDCKLAVIIETVNAFWRDTTTQLMLDKYAETNQLSLVCYFKKLITSVNNWCGGFVLMSVDGKIDFKHEWFQGNQYLGQKFGYYPLELLGNDGFEELDPFIPIYIDKYSNHEVFMALKYYAKTNWLQHPESRTLESFKEFAFLSDNNPLDLDRVISTV